MKSKKLEFIKNFIFSYSRTIITVATGIIYTYLIATYLGPEKYGKIMYFISFTVGFLGIFGIYFLQGLFWTFTPRYKSSSLFKKVLKIQYLLAIPLFFSLTVFSKQIVHFINRSDYVLLRQCAFLILLMPIYESFLALFRGFKQFGKTLKIEATLNIINLISAIFLVIILKMGIYGVLYAKIISILAGIVLSVYFYKSIKFMNKKVDYVEIKKFVYNGIPSSLFYRLKGQSFTVLLGMYILNAPLGIFYIAKKMVEYSIGACVKNFQTVVYPYMGEVYQENQKLSRYVSLNIKASLIISVLTGIPLIVFSRIILIYLFPEFVEAYKLIPLFVLLSTLSSVGITHNIYLSINRLDIIAKIFFASLVSTVLFGVILMPTYGVEGAILTLIFTELIQNGLYIHYLKDVGMDIEIIPRLRDFTYFWQSLREFLKIYSPK